MNRAARPFPKRYSREFQRYKTERSPNTFTYTFTHTHTHTYTKQRNNVNNEVVGQHQRRINSNATRHLQIWLSIFHLLALSSVPALCQLNTAVFVAVILLKQLLACCCCFCALKFDNLSCLGCRYRYCCCCIW